MNHALTETQSSTATALASWPALHALQATLRAAGAAQFDAVGSGFSAEDYFVLTRVDGRTSLKDIMLISGFPVDKAIAILQKLHDKHAIVLSAPAGSATQAPRASAAGAGPAEWAPLLAERVDLDETQKLAILRAHERLREGNFFEILGVAADADARALKRAYFGLSKDFHPDRFYSISSITPPE